MDNKKTTYMTKSDIVLKTLENKRFGEPKKVIKEESTYSEYNKRIDDIYNNKEKIIREYKEFEVRVKEDFLMESICKILIPSFDNLVDTPRKESICKGLVKDFIKEETVDGLLNEFKKGSSLLYELYDITNRYSQAVFERCDKNDCNTFNVDTDLKDDFFTELEEGDLNKVSDTLNARISNALDEFITDNLETKSQIQDIIDQTQERIDANKNMKESYSYYINEGFVKNFINNYKQLRDSQKDIRTTQPRLLEEVKNCNDISKLEKLEEAIKKNTNIYEDCIKISRNEEEKKQIKEHIKWLNTTYVKAIQNRIKELGKKKKNNNSLKEAYIDSMERRIVDLKRKRSKGVLEGMIYNVTESSVIDDEMKSIYFENGKLNLDKIVEETALLYGFLEMVNLCYMKKVDEQYILDNINGLKK